MKKGLLVVIALALLVFVGRQVAADATDTNTSDKGSVWRAKVADRQMEQWRERMAAIEAKVRKEIDARASVAGLERRAKIAAGPNANAVLSLDLIANGGAGNQTDDGVTSGTVSGRGTTIAVEVFATSVTTPLRGLVIKFDFDASVLTFVKAENSAFTLSLPERDETGINFAATSPVTLGSSGFIARAEFTTAVDVTGRAFTLGIATVSLLESNTSKDNLTTTDKIRFNANNANNANPSSDFDSDGTVGIPDFLQFVNHFGTSRGDAGYDAKYDLDNNGAIGIPDFLIFVDSFGSEVPPSGGSDTVTIPDANLRAVIADSLGKASGAPITRAEMATLTRLDAPNSNISDLTGLEHAINLQGLYLGGVWETNVNSNEISDLSPLSNLTNLTYLDLSSNSLSDISALANLTNLTYLDLSSTDLDLSSNSLSDISALANLTNLTRLDLAWNQSLSDISALANLTNLTRLDLAWNQSLSDISALANLTNLTELDLSSTHDVSDISALANLTNLTDLDLSNNSRSDISALANLTNLTWLFLYNNSISDLAPLVANTGLGSGDKVDVRSNPLSATSLNTHIPALQGRGVTVEF